MLPPMLNTGDVFSQGVGFLEFPLGFSPLLLRMAEVNVSLGPALRLVAIWQCCPLSPRTGSLGGMLRESQSSRGSGRER